MDKKSRSEERDFLAGMARFEGSAFGLLRKQPIMFGFAEGVRISLNTKSTTSKKAPSNDGTLLLAGMARFELTNKRLQALIYKVF